MAKKLGKVSDAVKKEEKKIIQGVIERNLTDVQKSNMLKYMLSLMYSRAVADIRDGFKPVHRRSAFAMNELGLVNSKPHKKAVRVVGDVLGKYHPHGDSSVYNAIVRLSQPFVQNIPVVDGHGNFGNISGDGAAAMRYTEIRLHKYTTDYLLADLNKNAVDTRANFDESLTEPTVLPAKTVNLLINGSSGIAAGYVQEVPPHNPKDIANMVIKLIKKPETSLREVATELMPDFPTGASLCSKNSIVNAYETGRGTVKVRANIEIEERKNREYLVITEIPYGKTIGGETGIVTSIANAVREKKIEGIADLKDYSNKKGIRIEILVKKDADAATVENLLYKHTPLENTVKIILVCVNGDYFKEYNIKEIFEEWIEFRRITIKRVFLYDIKRWKRRIHILEGLLIALSNIDDVIKIIKSSSDVSVAKGKLVTNYDLTKIQAQSIVDMKLSRLTGLEKQKLKDEKKELEGKVLHNLSFIKDTSKIDKIIIDEQKEIIKNYGFPRKTQLIEINTDITVEDTITDEQMMVTITNEGFVKRMKRDLKTQKRAGKGINFGKIKEDDFVTQNFFASTKDHLLCFTNFGRVFDIKVWEIKETKSTSLGSKITAYVKGLKDGEEITNVLCISNDQFNDDESFLLFCTKNAQIKKTKMEEFSNIRTSGIIAMMLRKDDELTSVKYIDSGKEMQDIFVSTLGGQAIRYEHTEVRASKRDSFGMSAINLTEDGDEVASMDIIDDENTLVLGVTSNGLGKVTKITDMVEKNDPKSGNKTQINDGFPRQKRTSKSTGRLMIKLKEDNYLVKSMIVKQDDDIAVTTSSNIIRVCLDEFKPIKRPTYGMKLVNVDEDNFVIDVAVAPK